MEVQYHIAISYVYEVIILFKKKRETKLILKTVTRNKILNEGCFLKER